MPYLDDSDIPESMSPDELMASQLLEVKCRLAILLNDVMDYNATVEADGHLGTSKDLEKRTEYLQLYETWRNTLQPELQLSNNFTPAICLQA
jgi:hypothetical protein